MPDIQSITIGKKLKAYFEDQSISQSQVAERLGVSQPAISALLNGKPFGKNTAKKWSDEFGVKLNWLITGEGEMLKSGNASMQKLTTDEYLLVPMYNLDARGGFQGNDIVDAAEYIEKHIPFPAARKLDICVPVSGDSMIPVYPPGSIILLREVSGWREYFGFGGNFMLILKDGRRIIKRVQKSIDDARNNVLCVSYNHLVDDEELPKKMIDKVYKVIRTLTDEGY